MIRLVMDCELFNTGGDTLKSRLLVRLLLILFVLLLSTSILDGGASATVQSNFLQRTYLPIVLKPVEGLAVSQVKIIQGTSASHTYTILIAGRATMVRVFVDTTGGSSRSGVTGRLCVFDGANQSLGCLSADNGSITAPSHEEVLNSTLNFKLPLQWVEPNYSYHVEVGTGNLNTNTADYPLRFPTSGERDFNFVSVPNLNVAVIPVAYQPYGSAQSFLPKTDDLSYLTDLPIKLFPVSAIEYQGNHLPYTYAPSSPENNLTEELGWATLLGDLTMLHQIEDSSGSKNYYGIVNSYSAHGCAGGCITGIGWLNAMGAYKTAVGWSGFGPGTLAASETMAHEMGHNFNRRHVSCSGTERDPDYNYPYPGGKIGQFGLDVTAGQLYQPDQYADYMSYCDPTWTSDYTFWNIYQYLRTPAQSVSLEYDPVDTLYISGLISPQGEILLRPVYAQRSRLPVSGPDGIYRLEILDQHGQPAIGYPFDTYEIADSGGYRGFGFIVPDPGDLAGLRVSKDGQVLVDRRDSNRATPSDIQAGSVTVDRSQGRIHLSWSGSSGQEGAYYRLRYSQDGGDTWQLLAVNWVRNEFSLPQTLVSGVDQGLIEIQASDGLRTNTAILNLEP